jgi:hypothetical protein
MTGRLWADNIEHWLTAIENIQHLPNIKVTGAGNLDPP